MSSDAFSMESHMPSLLFDSSVIANGLAGQALGRTGVYRYANSLLRAIAMECSGSSRPSLITLLPQVDRSQLLAFKSELESWPISIPQILSGIVFPFWVSRLLQGVLDGRVISGLERRIQMATLQFRLKELLRIKPDGLIYFTPYDLASWLPSSPYFSRVICIHDLIPIHFPQYCQPSSMKLFSRLQLQLPDMDGIICGSNTTRDDLLNWLPVLRSKPIAVIPYAVDDCFSYKYCSHDSELLQGYGIIPRQYILSVGTLEPRKNLGTLLTAYSKLFLRLGDAVPRLVLCGPAGWGDLALVEQIKNLQLEGKIIFTGFVSNQFLATLYRNATCFVFPSVCEGFGLPVLEAISSGTPVLSSNHPAMVEVLGDAALFFNPFNSDLLSVQLERIISDQELQQNLRLLGLARAQQFSWQISARRTINFARSLRKLAS
ncbi:glycosyltransferase family 1 protein [Synechococcus sp. UW140]|uniref:glycosyltransferase family 4 protein n=1 Tax=Synechococcus sp. UW140 TaxID=368503 RepID=UPI003137A50B